MSRKTLGVIGGLGPVATSHFMELVIRMTDAALDQQHLDMIVYHTPSIPDRSSYILDHSLPSPLEPMIRLGRELERQKAACVAIPCITAHFFHEQLCENIALPILNGVEETARQLCSAGISRAGILATTGTIQAGLFQRALEQRGIQPLIPSEQGQKDVMHVIFENVKAGVPVDMGRFEAAARELKAQGAQVIVLGCTELSLVKRDHPLGAGYLDALEVLAQQAVVFCNGALKSEYRNLITTDGKE